MARHRRFQRVSNIIRVVNSSVSFGAAVSGGKLSCFPTIVYLCHVANNNIVIFGFCHVIHGFKHLFIDPVIGIDKADIFAPCFIYPEVSSITQSTIFLFIRKDDTWILFNVLIDNLL